MFFGHRRPPPLARPAAPITGRRSVWHWLGAVALAWGLSPALSAQELLLEIWRKDDQIFWEKQIIAAFERKHPGICVRFRSEDPLYYDQKLDARLVSRTADDLMYCRPFTAA